MAIVAGDLGHIAEHNRLSGVPLGTLSGGYAQIVASLTGISTLQDLTGLSVTVTVGTSRRIRISFECNVTGTVANNSGAIVIRESTTTLREVTLINPIVARQQTLSGSVVIQPTAGSHTYKLSMQLDGGTGQVSCEAAATRPAYILVEDVGV